MRNNTSPEWENLVSSPEKIFSKIKPGMSIFLGTGVSAPRSLIRHLKTVAAPNLKDLELIQIICLDDAVPDDETLSDTYRLKTFTSGESVRHALSRGLVDLVPCRLAKIPQIFESDQMKIDAAFIQISQPDESGYCSLGASADAAGIAIQKARFTVGEINKHVPKTFGDTSIHVSEFNALVHSTEPLHYFHKSQKERIFDKIASRVAALITDGSCMAFFPGPFYEALSRHLSDKSDLGIHSPVITDDLMDLIKTGAITNRLKRVDIGKTIVSYAIGSPALMDWLHENTSIEFHTYGRAHTPVQIGTNPNFIAITHARKIDLAGNITLHAEKENFAPGPGEISDFFYGAELSHHGRALVVLPSRNLNGKSNIKISLERIPNQFSHGELIDTVVTEYGIADLEGRTVRERAQALIDIAHPDDRSDLVEQAKEKNILYQDQIFRSECAYIDPDEIAHRHLFKNNLQVRFRALKPSDEEGMRRLFYRFSDESIYYRYFRAVDKMPHADIQKYVNLDCNQATSVVGLTGEPGRGKIIAEARFHLTENPPLYAEVAFIVDEKHQNSGICSYLYGLLVKLAKQRGIQGFSAEILAKNRGMMKVFEKGDLPVMLDLAYGVYYLTIPFDN